MPVDPDDPASDWLGNAISVKTIMVKPNSIQPTLEWVQRTLRGGGRVWIVGYISQLPEGASRRPCCPHRIRILDGTTTPMRRSGRST